MLPGIALPALAAALVASVLEGTDAVSLEAESPVRQEGSDGPELRRAASGGAVLGQGFGSRGGHFAEYEFEVGEPLEPARISIRYARALPGHAHLEVVVDGTSFGILRYPATGGWGDEPEDFEWLALDIPELAQGKHTLRLEVIEPPTREDFPRLELAPSAVLDRAGGRADKRSVGHGRNVALYTGTPSRFFFATHELGNIFSAVDGGTLVWYPDQVHVSPQEGGSDRPRLDLDWIVISESPVPLLEARPEAPAPVKVIEVRQVCVTPEDVVVSRIHLFNPSDEAVRHRVLVTGDSTGSRNWRGKPGGEKVSRKTGDFMALIDKNVFPGILDGLAMVIGGKTPPTELTTTSAGTYSMLYEVEVPARSKEELLLGCAIHPDVAEAQKNLIEVLRADDPVAANRRAWAEFYDEAVPRFECSDPGLAELYAFRWFLLAFSTAGGDLGYFRYPVVLEGRQAYQTYCCFSAPFLAFDLNWAADSRAGFGQIASLAAAAYEDGRFPWYTAPNTNRVPIHHRSGTGLSLLALAAWKHYLVHGRKEELRAVYDPLARNMDWWIEDRDPDGDGIFVIDHQLETGMDDLMRWPDPRLRYLSVDASSYAYANLRALAAIARELGETSRSERFAAFAEKTARALDEKLWDEEGACWRARHPESGEFTRLLPITIFYPYFAGAGDERHLEVFRKYLLDPGAFWLPHPVPALSKSDPQFDPRGFWRGPSWPAATSHVIEAFAASAKRYDRSLLPEAGALFLRAARNHLRPRADFYERYDPLTGEPLSSFRDYMHSWWIDLFVRHVAGFEPRPDGGFTIDPLPLGLERCSLSGIPYRGRRIDVAYRPPGDGDGPAGPGGLIVRVDGRAVVSRPDFVPGEAPVEVGPEAVPGGGTE